MQEFNNITKQVLKESTIAQRHRWAYEGICEAKHFIYLAIGLYFTGMLIGFIYPDNFKSYLSAFEKYINHTYNNRGILSLIFFIFMKNMSVSIMSIVLGFLLGLFPIYTAIMNGAMLGLVASISTTKYELLLLLPHGVFEIPAVLISFGLGIWNGAWILRANKQETFENRWHKSMITFFTFALPLLTLAAIIEGVAIKYFEQILK